MTVCSAIVCVIVETWSGDDGRTNLLGVNLTYLLLWPSPHHCHYVSEWLMGKYQLEMVHACRE